MEFNIDIKTTINGRLIIIDTAKKYNQYIEGDYVDDPKKYKYKDSATFNILIKPASIDRDLEVIDLMIHDHEMDEDYCVFNLDNDGHYIVHHIVLPTIDWYQNVPEEILSKYKTIYITDYNTVYKLVNNEFEPCPLTEIITCDPNETTIQICSIDTFYTGNLQECYINYSKKLFDSLLNTCERENIDTFSRDFIWMTLNVIDYLVGFKQFEEAERIINMFNKCGGYCKEIKERRTGCGCS